MAQFDNWPMFQDFSFQEFHFPLTDMRNGKLEELSLQAKFTSIFALSITVEDFLTEKQV